MSADIATPDVTTAPTSINGFSECFVTAGCAPSTARAYGKACRHAQRQGLLDNPAGYLCWLVEQGFSEGTCSLRIAAVRRWQTLRRTPTAPTRVTRTLRLLSEHVMAQHGPNSATRVVLTLSAAFQPGGLDPARLTDRTHVYAYATTLPARQRKRFYAAWAALTDYAATRGTTLPTLGIVPDAVAAAVYRLTHDRHVKHTDWQTMRWAGVRINVDGQVRVAKPSAGGPNRFLLPLTRRLTTDLLDTLGAWASGSVDKYPELETLVLPRAPGGTTPFEVAELRTILAQGAQVAAQQQAEQTIAERRKAEERKARLAAMPLGPPVDEADVVPIGALALHRPDR